MAISSYTLKQVMDAMGFREGRDYRVTSIGRRRVLAIGAKAKSHHVQGNALDVAGPTVSYAADRFKGRIFDAWAPYAPHLLELIYAFRTKNVKRGRWIDAYAKSIHKNHVHIAATPANATRILEMVRAKRGLTAGVGASASGSLGLSGVAGAGGYAGPLVQRGAKGAEVRAIQERLQQLGYQVRPDSDFGTETYNAVRAFQRRRGLKVDGVVGSDTWNALF